MKSFSYIFFMIIFILSCSEQRKVEVIASNTFCNFNDFNIKTFSYLLVDKSDLLEYKESEIISFLGPKEKFPDNYNSSLIIFLGKRSSNIYSIKFLKYSESEKKISFFVKEEIKKGNLTVETYPCLTLRIPKTEKDIEVIWDREPLEAPISRKETIEYQ
tara:strand:- start:62 stop:538 length:477 start_codon:yes stop_codon:yes gene_type:complete